MRFLPVALVLAAAGCATAPGAPYDSIAKQFRYKLDFDRGQELSTPTDRVEILEVWGTRPEIEIGGEYMVERRSELENWKPYGLVKPIPANLRNYLGMLDVMEGKGPIYMRTEEALQKIAGERGWVAFP